jgi:protein phosphatase 2C family protein 2/3
MEMHAAGLGPERSGSCATVVLIVNDMIYVSNVGDSRAILSMDYG